MSAFHACYECSKGTIARRIRISVHQTAYRALIGVVHNSHNDTPVTESHHIPVQEYEGREQDVSIMPWADHINVFRAFFSIIKNPTEEEYKDILHAGQRSSFPHVARIRAHCLVERTLDK